MRIQNTDDGLNQTIFSAWEKITDGVSQGSSLGPLPFLLYIKLAVPSHALLWLILVKCKRRVSSLLQVSAVQHTFG
jgi:hypothetical protein